MLIISNIICIFAEQIAEKMVYSLSYELKSTEKDYTSLFNYLEHELGSGGIHVMRDTWWVASDNELDINATCDKIRSFMGEKDHFFFTKLSETAINGWLPSSSWDYFSAKNKKKE